MRERKGFGLLAAIFIILVFAVLAAGFVSLFTSESRMVVEEYRYSKAFYIAEAGKNFAIQHISNYPAWSVDVDMGMPLTRSFGGGSFTVSTSGETKDALTLFSTGLFTEEGKTYSRTIRARIAKDWPDPFKYVIFWDNTGQSPETILELGTTTKGINVIGDVVAKGRVWVRSKSSITGGTIYAHAGGTSPQVILDPEAVIDTWEAISNFPAFATVNYSYYDNLIASYEALLPVSSTLDINLNLSNSPYNLNTSPYNANGIIKCRKFTVENCLIYGSVLIAATDSIKIKHGTIVSPEGGSIVFANGSSGTEDAEGRISVGGETILKKGPPELDHGIIFLNQTGRIRFSGSTLEAHDILVLTKDQIKITRGPNIVDNSILYSQAENDEISFDEIIGSFVGSILSRGRLYLYEGKITGVIFNDSAWGTLAELSEGSYVHGPMISRKFQNNRIAGGKRYQSETVWDPVYLPEFPPGVTFEGVTVNNWQEVY